MGINIGPISSGMAKHLIEQTKGLDLTDSQMKKVEDLILRVLDLTDKRKIQWRTKNIGHTSNASFFFRYSPSNGTELIIHRHVSFIRDINIDYDITIKLDKSDIGTFKGRPIDDLGELCYTIFGIAKIREAELSQDKVISQLDRMATLTRVNKTKSGYKVNSRFIKRENEELAEEYTEPTTEKREELDRSAFYNDNQSYDKEKKKSGKFSKLLKSINPLNPILDGLRHILKK